MKKVDVVLLHGWGLNSAIWSSFIELAASIQPMLSLHAMDLPGYGALVNQPGSSDLDDLAEGCLARAPKNAIWLGWSLGGMVAMQAAMRDTRGQISGLQLISTSPCFVQGADWPNGVDLDVFRRFEQALSNDYQAALSTFLVLQSGSNHGARDLAREARNAVCQWPAPSPETLQRGIDCLAKYDLRKPLSDSRVFENRPTQVVSGCLDRIANPAGGKALAEMLNAQLHELRSGHAPFLTRPKRVLELLTDLVRQIYGY